MGNTRRLQDRPVTRDEVINDINYLRPSQYENYLRGAFKGRFSLPELALQRVLEQQRIPPFDQRVYLLNCYDQLTREAEEYAQYYNT